MSVVWIILLSLCAIFLVFLGWLLCAPLEAGLSTAQKKAWLSLSPFFRMEIRFPEGPKTETQMSVLGKQIKTKGPAEKRSSTVMKKAKPQKYRYALTRKAFMEAIRLLGTFRMDVFHLDVDTGDVISNAHLYPVFGTVRGLLWYKENLRLDVNFMGRVDAEIRISNRPYRLLWRGLKLFFAIERKRIVN